VYDLILNSKHKASSYQFTLWVASLLLIGCLSILACAPVVIPVYREARPSNEEHISRSFSRADQLLKEKKYREALAIYEDYLRRYPGGFLRDMALMKSGIIYAELGAYDVARRSFNRIISDHPESRFFREARFRIAMSYMKEGSYEEAITHAKDLLRTPLSRQEKLQIYPLLGEAYLGIKDRLKAVDAYSIAYYLATGAKKAALLSRIEGIIRESKEDELIVLEKRYNEGVFAGIIRFELGRRYRDQGLVRKAAEKLKDFLTRFPHHPRAKEARTILSELREGLLVDRFTIGCVLPLTGRYSTFGNRALNGIELALDRFNSQPEVHEVQIIIRDSGSDPRQTIKAVEDLGENEHVMAIIGPMITAESAAIKAQSLKVPIMVMTQKPDIIELGDYVFRDFLTSDRQVRGIVSYAIQELGLKKFAVLYPEERYGTTFMNLFTDELIANGGELVCVGSYGKEQTDFGDAIEKLVGLHNPETEGDKSDPVESGAEKEEKLKPVIEFEAMFIPDTFQKVGLIAPQLAYHGVTNILLLGTNLWHSEKLIEMASDYVQGAIISEGFFAESPSPAVQEFVRTFKEVFGRMPAFLEAQAYDTATILFSLVNRPQVWSRHSLKNALLSLKDFPGVTGVTSFRQNGEADKPVYLLKIVGQRFVQVR